MKRMYLEGIVVCRDYSDLLTETLPINKSIFDYLVVVTSPEDEETKKCCEHWNVHCIQTDVLAGKDFPKGAAINVGLAALSRKDWVVHMDADIALPPLTRSLLEQANLDKSMLYGIDRHTIRSAKAWREHLRHPKLQQEANAYIHAEAYPIATRFATSHMGGYVPIGFFQLWNPSHSGVSSYPESHTGAGRTDMLFAGKWPRSKRSFLPEIIAYHLESEAAPQGANWDGRQTIPFDMKPPWCRPFHWWWWKRRHRRHHRHHHRHHHHPYCIDDD